MRTFCRITDHAREKIDRYRCFAEPPRSAGAIVASRRAGGILREPASDIYAPLCTMRESNDALANDPALLKYRPLPAAGWIFMQQL